MSDDSEVLSREPRDPNDPLTEQEREVYHLSSVWRMNQYQIAEKLGISQQRVSVVLRSARSKMPPVDLTELRRSVIDAHDHMVQEFMKLAAREGAPVTAGKDGGVVYDPETGEVVRDYGLRMSSLAEIRRTLAELRKLEGLDAATKVEAQATVRYVVEGVEMGDLK